jgi:hypothetical protein
MSYSENETDPKPSLEDWSRMSWSAIFVGALTALAFSVMLHVLGLGVTASILDTNASPSDAHSVVAGVTGIWFLASTAISLFIGGYIASTLAHTFTGGRAVLYGITVWALTTLITMSVVVPSLVRGAGAAITTAGTLADRAGAALGGATAQAGQLAPGLVDNLQRTLIGTPSGQVDQAVVQDVTRLLGQRFVQGEWSPQQRDQLTNDVAKLANISPEDARRRVDEAQSTINSTVEKAKVKMQEAAEITRKAVSAAAYATFGAMLVGLLFALLGAHFGELDEEHLPPFAKRLRFRTTRLPSGPHFDPRM